MSEAFLSPLYALHSALRTLHWALCAVGVWKDILFGTHSADEEARNWPLRGPIIRVLSWRQLNLLLTHERARAQAQHHAESLYCTHTHTGSAQYIYTRTMYCTYTNTISALQPYSSSVLHTHTHTHFPVVFLFTLADVRLIITNCPAQVDSWFPNFLPPSFTVGSDEMQYEKRKGHSVREGNETLFV